MDKEIFNNLEIDKQIEEFNKLIASEGSIRKACDVLHIGKTTIRDRFKKHGYAFKDDKYVKDTNTQLEGQTSFVEPVNAKYDTTELEQIVNRLIDKRLEDLKKVEKTGEIELNFEGKTMYRSFGINENTLNRFNEYAKKHSRFNKVELLSLALNELMDKYK